MSRFDFKGVIQFKGSKIMSLDGDGLDAQMSGEDNLYASNIVWDFFTEKNKKTHTSLSVM